MEALPSGLKQEEADTSISGQAIRRINELFALDKTLANKTPEERQHEKLDELLPWNEEVKNNCK